MSQQSSLNDADTIRTELAYIHGRWLAFANPTLDQARVYSSNLQELFERFCASGVQVEAPKVHTVGQLLAWSRLREEEWTKAKALSTTAGGEVADEVKLLWSRMREFPAQTNRPNEPPAPRDYQDAVDAAREVIMWCVEVLGGTAAAPSSPAASMPPVVLGKQGDNPVVLGNAKKPLTQAQHDVLQALLKAGAGGLDKELLVRKSGHPDAVNVLKRLKRSDADWGKVIQLAGQAGVGYRIMGV